MKYSYLGITILLVLTGFLYSCADLTTSVKDVALGEEEINNPEAGIRTLAPAYLSMNFMLNRHDRLNNLQGVSSIEQIVPFRGGTDWFDGGRFFEMHQHNWTPQHTSLISVWSSSTQGIGRAALAEKTIIDGSGDTNQIAEARGLKAVYNYWLLDMWNVAFESKPENVGTSTLSDVYKGADAVEYLLSELTAIESQLPTIEQVGEIRFNRSAAIGMKARLLLNKAVYSDRYASSFNFEPADMQSVIDYTTQLINSGTFSLESENYFYLFGMENENHPEIIFSFNQEVETRGQHRLSYFHASRDRFASLIYRKTGSDGGSLTQDFYDMWEGWREDPRFFHRFLPDGGTIKDEDFRWNRGIQIGQQYGIIPREGTSTDWQRDENGDLLILPLVDNSRSGKPMIYTREVGLTEDNDHITGPRSLKWDMDRNAPGSASSVNIPLLRLGEIYLMRAEAHARLGDWTSALNDVNTVRNARGARNLTASELSTTDHLFREYMFEMYHEHWSRTYMIRFGKFEDSWRDKTSTDVNKRVFPIPQFAIDAAQSESGYLEQNPGY